MKMRDLKELTVEELLSQLKESTEALFNLRVQAATGEIQDPKKLTQTRKEIARIKTLLNEYKLGIKQE